MTMQTLTSIGEDLKWLAAYGVWDILSLLIVVGGIVWGYLRFFRPVQSIPNLTVFYRYQRAPNQSFPLQLTIEFVNHTGRSMFITSAWFKCKSIRPDPNARLDAGTRRLEIKFPTVHANQSGTPMVLLSEFEHFLRDGESVSTYAPLDPTHSEEDIRAALQVGSVGYLDCYVTLLSRDHKPFIYRLRTFARMDFGIHLGVLPYIRWKFLN